MKRLFPIVCLFLMCFTTTAVFATERDDPGDSDKSPTVTSPKGGESWKTGTTQTIKWSKGSGFNFVKIQLLKSGKHSLWVSNKTTNDGKYSWAIPSTVATGSTYKVKITATTDDTLSDTSNSNFTITKTGGGGSGSLTVTTPNGGQKWKTGKRYVLKWSHKTAGAYVKIQLLKSGKHSLWITKKTKNDGKHPWKIPSTVATGSAYKIKITSTSKPTVKDQSNANFKITKDGAANSTITVSSPNGGQKWTTGKRYWIKWAKLDGAGRVKIELLKSGTTALVISNNAKNGGRLKWKIPSSVETGGSYKIKITSTTDNGNTDSSDSNFTITKAGTIPTVSLACTPDSASESGGKFTCTVTLSNSTSKKVTIAMTYSGTATAGTDYSNPWVSRVIKAGRTSSSWTITGKSDSDANEGDETIVVDISSVTNATEDGTQQVSLTLEDDGGAAGSLTVTSPNGGESWTTGKSYALKWTQKTAGAYVKIQLLKSDKHSLWISKKTKNDGKYAWKIPDTVNSNSAYKVRITSTSKSTVKDESNANFTITKAVSSSLTVTTPNGGESWTTGKSYVIKWDKQDAGTRVKIQLLESGTDHLLISGRTKNDGKHPWTIPSTVAAGTAYKIKITSTTKKTVTDSSSSNFTITKGSCAKALDITNPKGGEIWKVGAEYEITWCSSSTQPTVQIKLAKHKRHLEKGFITEFTDNDGSYLWTIPEKIGSHKLKDTYLIKISFGGDKSTAVSEFFTICCGP